MSASTSRPPLITSTRAEANVRPRQGTSADRERWPGSESRAPRPIWQPAKAIVRRIRHYSELVRWIGGDSLWRFRGMVLAILASGSIALLGHAAAIGIIARFAHMLEHNQSVKWMGVTLAARSSFGLLAICGGALLAVLVMAALLTHVSERKAIRLRRRYQEHCTAVAVSRLAAGFHVWPTDGCTPVDITDVTRIARGDAMLNGRVASMLVTGIIPAFTTILAVGAMIVLNPMATIMILVLISASGYFLYRVNLAAARASEDLERLASSASSGFRRQLNTLRDSSDHTELNPEALAKQLKSGAMRDHLDARDRSMIAVKTSRLVSDLTIAVIMCIILLTLGVSLIHQGTGWGLLLAFLIVVRQGLTNFRTITQTLVSINRFYPQLRRYRDFIEATQPLPATASPPAQVEVQLGANGLEGSQEFTTISPGDRVLLLCASAPNRYTAGFLIDLLTGSNRAAWLGATRSLRFVNVRQGIDEQESIARQFGLPRGVTRQDLADVFGKEEMPRQWQECLPASLDESISPEVWQSVPRGARAAISALAAIKSDAQWILIDQEAMKFFPDEARKRLLEVLAPRCVVIVSRDVAALDDSDVPLALIADRGEIAGIGTTQWASGHQKLIAEMLGRTTAARFVAGVEGDDDVADE